MKLNRLYTYKIVVDNGGAPCDQDGLLTLAICKPMIRSFACENDWIFGFGGNSLNQRLIYIAQITKILSGFDYYSKPQYKHRRDCIYSLRNKKFITKKSALYHQEGRNILQDLGNYPKYSRAKVILSRNYKYLGHKGRSANKSDYPAINKLLKSLKRGYRVHHSAKNRIELEKLQKEIWRRYSNRNSIGDPSHEIPALSHEYCSCG